MARLKALVVDDKPDQLKLVVKLLNSLDIDTVTAGGGEDAVKLTLSPEPSQSAFDFLMLDIHMPNVGGIEVAKQVREGGYKGAIFAFTAHPTMDNKKKGEGLGINAFLSKLTMKKELMEALIFEHVKPKNNPSA